MKRGLRIGRSSVRNAAALGRGSGGIDGNFLAAGSGVLQGSGGSSGGFGIPNPDARQGFKAQTGRRNIYRKDARSIQEVH